MMSSMSFRNGHHIGYGLPHGLWLLRKSISRQSGSIESRRTVNRLLRIFSSGLQRPIFIIGAPRSSTTFLGKCIAKLPGVAYFNEPDATKFATSQLGEKRWPAWLTAHYYTLVCKLLVWGRSSGRNPRFAEKTPRNCFFVRFLKNIFPSAVFIHIIRDGRDAALSLSKKPWLVESQSGACNREPGGYRCGPYPRFWVEHDRREEFSLTSDMHRYIWSWKRHVESALDASRSLNESEYLELRYENLCRSPIKNGKRISDFLGSKVKSKSEYFRKIKCASTSPIGNHINELTRFQKEDIYEEAEDLLENIGYK